MKTALKTASTAIKRWLAWYRMRSVEINLSNMIDAHQQVRCEDTRAAMSIAIKRASKELCRARAEYQSYLQPGQRIVWDIA